jgi:hypothetical protein
MPDRPGVHVGVGVEIVGMRVVRIVLVEPPPVTETVEQVRGEQTEHPAGPFTTTDLTVGRVVTEEPDLRGDDSERRRKQQRPPGVVHGQQGGHCRRQCEQGDAEQPGVVPRASVHQTELPDLGCQLGITAGTDDRNRSADDGHR